MGKWSVKMLFMFANRFRIDHSEKFAFDCMGFCLAIVVRAISWGLLTYVRCGEMAENYFHDNATRDERRWRPMISVSDLCNEMERSNYLSFFSLLRRTLCLFDAAAVAAVVLLYTVYSTLIRIRIYRSSFRLRLLSPENLWPKTQFLCFFIIRRYI